MLSLRLNPIPIDGGHRKSALRRRGITVLRDYASTVFFGTKWHRGVRRVLLLPSRPVPKRPILTLVWFVFLVRV